MLEGVVDPRIYFNFIGVKVGASGISSSPFEGKMEGKLFGSKWQGNGKICEFGKKATKYFSIHLRSASKLPIQTLRPPIKLLTIQDKKTKKEKKSSRPGHAENRLCCEEETCNKRSTPKIFHFKAIAHPTSHKKELAKGDQIEPDGLLR